MTKTEQAKSIASATFNSIITWSWTKALLNWLIMSAGTMSECAFLVASIWMSINSSVHAFVLIFMSETMSVDITQLATTAYVALPECILGLAIVTVINHYKMWLYGKSKIALLWSILFGIPTSVFLFLSLFTVANAVMSAAMPGAHIDFTLPIPFIVARALAGYMFALTSLIYTSLGKPQEKDRLQEKDNTIAKLRRDHENELTKEREEKDLMIAQLTSNHDAILAKTLQEKDGMISQSTRYYDTELSVLRREKESVQDLLNAEKARLNEQIDRLKKENESQRNLLIESQNKESELLKAMNKSDESALEAYSEECINWLKSGAKTVMVTEIMRYTGHSKRKIEGAINKGLLQTATRNKELITVSSLIEWLKNTPVMNAKMEQDSGPLLHIVNE